MTISPQQLKFVNNLASGKMNQGEAYLSAYPNIKNAETAWASASRLLRNVRVMAELEKAKAMAAKRAEITSERILREETRIAFSDIRELFSGETIKTPNDLPKDIRRALSGVQVIRKSTPKGHGAATEHTTIYKYRLWDKGRALDRLSKHLGFYEKDNQQKQKLSAEVIEAILSALPPEFAAAVRRRLGELIRAGKNS